MSATHLEADARSVLAEVDRDPRAAAVQAGRLLTLARHQGDDAAASVAGRAAGLAAIHLGRLDTAVGHLERAQQSGESAGSKVLAAESGMTLAFALARKGDAQRSLRTMTRAVEDLSGVARARALAQRGAIRQQFDQLDLSLADYRTALPVLRDAAEWVWVQRIHCNRAVLFIYRGHLSAAEAELGQAQRLCAEHGLGLQLAFVTENLAFLHMRRGDVPAALHHFDQAERQHSDLGAGAGTVLIDRSELLLSIGLAAEARDAARSAVEELTRTRRFSARAQAQLLLADACLLAGDITAARAAATAAAAAFRSQQRPEWAALARQTLIRCRLLGGGPLGVSAQTLENLAATMEKAGLALPALDTRLLAAKVALQQTAGPSRSTVLDLPASARLRGPVERRVRAWHVEALRRLSDGRPRAALSALRAGVRLVEEHQLTLGATDLRSSVSGHRAELVEQGLGLCLSAGRPREVLRWAERGRATALLNRPLRPPADAVLAQHLVDLRGAAADVEAARGRGQSVEPLLRLQADLERRVRDRARLVPGSHAAAQHPAVADLATALADRALVEFVEHDGCLNAVTVIDGQVALTRLGPTGPVAALTDHIPLALHRLARVNGAPRATTAAQQLLVDIGSRLDALLLAPLRHRLGERRVVVVPSRTLFSVPWALLPSCSGRPVVISPSAALWFRAQARPPGRETLAVVAGPGLAAADGEVVAVAELYPDAVVLRGEHATVASVTAALSRAGTAHIAAHGTFRGDNALFSHLRLADGPLTVYDLEALPQVPGVVVLAACDTARNSISSGDEVLGLAAAFLGLGTSILIASLVPVADSAVTPLMVALHRMLRAGLSPSAALAALQQEVGQTGSRAERAAALGLVCFGADPTGLASPRRLVGQAAPVRRASASSASTAREARLTASEVAATWP